MANQKRIELMKQLGAAKASGFGNNFRDGKYRLCVKSLSIIDGFKGVRFQVKFTVVNSLKIPVVEKKTGKTLDINPNPALTDVDWLQVGLEKKDSAGPGNTRRFVQDLMGAKDISDEDYNETLCALVDIDPETGESITPPHNPGRGMLIDMETVRIETVKNKVEIVGCNFSNVPDSTYDQAQWTQWLDQVTQMQLAQAQQAMNTPGALPAGQEAAA